MSGTIFRMKVKPGQEDKVIEHMESWRKTREPKVVGALGGLLLKPDRVSGELVGAAVFTSKETYRANAADPEQHQWFLSLRELLEADPEWEDGEFIRAEIGKATLAWAQCRNRLGRRHPLSIDCDGARVYASPCAILALTPDIRAEGPLVGQTRSWSYQDRHRATAAAR